MVLCVGDLTTGGQSMEHIKRWQALMAVSSSSTSILASKFWISFSIHLFPGPSLALSLHPLDYHYRLTAAPYLPDNDGADRQVLLAVPSLGSMQRKLGTPLLRPKLSEHDERSIKLLSLRHKRAG